MAQDYVLNKFIPYLRGKLNDLGFQEHDDEFDEDNVPSTVLDKTYLITPGRLSSSRSSHSSYEWTFPVVVTLFISGYRKPSDAVDSALEIVENLLDECLDVSSRYGINGIQDVFPTDVAFSPIDSSNYSVIQISVGMTAILNMYNDKNC